MPHPDLPFPPMEAQLVSELPSGDWQYEPKWDGLLAEEPRVPARAPSFLWGNLRSPLAPLR